MKTWPNWHPGQELKAAHLFGLEDFLLSRSELIDEQSHGVDFFDRETSIIAHPSDGAVEIEVGNLRGVTPGGHPIALDDGFILKERIGTGEGGVVTFEAMVEINNPDKQGKLVLHLTPVEDDPDMPRKLESEARKLDLGRFRWRSRGSVELDLASTKDSSDRSRDFDGEARMLDLGQFSQPSDGSVEQIRRPMVRRFEALKPLDEAWRNWVRPLSANIDVLAKGLERERLSLPLIALSVELNRLSFEWPSITVSQLVRRLHLVNWLRVPPKEREDLVEFLADLTQFPPAGSTGDNLPERLARILEIRISSTVMGGPRHLKADSDIICAWKHHFWEAKFLRALPNGRLELHIPTKANPPESLSLQNRELTYVRTVQGQSRSRSMVYALGALPIEAGSVFRFRLHKVDPQKLADAEFRFIEEIDDD